MLHVLLSLLVFGAPPPAQDFDKDGVIDLEDDCPTDAGNPANNGCPGDSPPPPAPPPPEDEPDIEVAGNKLSIDEKIRFKTGSASVDPRSFDLLRRIAKAIEALPADARISVEGHTDARGSKRLNQRLSQRRAQAVVAHLVRHGVARERLKAKGFGQSRPIASNATRAGRAKNRRVEFIIQK